MEENILWSDETKIEVSEQGHCLANTRHLTNTIQYHVVRGGGGLSGARTERQVTLLSSLWST